MNKESGFTLFIAIVVMGTLLLISTGVATLISRQSLISNVSRESQRALYAANTGMECAFYWDVGNPSGMSAFSTTTGSSISCHGNSSVTVGGNPTSSFRINLTPSANCVDVTVVKSTGGSTRIESKGYNSCDPASPVRRVERAVRAVY